MTTVTPSTWTDLRDEIQRRRTATYDVACDLADEGKDGAERAYGRVDVYDEMLRLMAHLAGEPVPEPSGASR
jgi:hypothetical protein